ncbi:MAG: substrate-binding domain-containing protein [Brooklawnia sp.]|uniref:substrate-binding domain-containing protein n=1 Tax=Brooklawnia sp. TaxID=2699740 RepID=UPI003C71A2AA
MAHLGAEEALPPLPVATDEAGADEALPSLLAAIGKVDVAVCASDELALRLLHVLVWRRVRVPQDLAVVGWGGSAAADYVVPRLTTVRDRSRELGELAAARLRARLAGDDAGDQPQTLRGEVVWRESTGRPG